MSIITRLPIVAFALAGSILTAPLAAQGTVFVSNKSGQVRQLKEVTLKQGNNPLVETIEVENCFIGAGGSKKIESSTFSDPKIHCTTWKGTVVSEDVRGPSGFDSTMVLDDSNGPLPGRTVSTVLLSQSAPIMYSVTVADLAQIIPVPENQSITVAAGRDLSGFYPASVVFMDKSLGVPYSGSLQSAGEAEVGKMWAVLGGGKPGYNGQTPVLTADGFFTGGETITLTLSQARPNASTILVVGLSALELPFAGGVLVPNPDMSLALPTDGAGNQSLPLVLPPLVPDLCLWLQHWVIDPDATFGLAASDGLKGVSH